VIIVICFHGVRKRVRCQWWICFWCNAGAAAKLHPRDAEVLNRQEQAWLGQTRVPTDVVAAGRAVGQRSKWRPRRRRKETGNFCWALTLVTKILTTHNSVGVFSAAASHTWNSLAYWCILTGPQNASGLWIRYGPNVRLWHSAEAKGLCMLTEQVPNFGRIVTCCRAEHSASASAELRPISTANGILCCQ